MADNQKFSSFLKSHLLTEEKIILEYNGVFDQSAVKHYAFQISESTKNFIVTQRRAFYVYVELAQNVGFYSEIRDKSDEKDIGIGNFLMFEAEDYFGFAVGNVVNNKAVTILKRKCKIINSFINKILIL